MMRCGTRSPKKVKEAGKNRENISPGKDNNVIEEPVQTQLEAAVLRQLVSHLVKRSDVQNIDLMNLAGFCRNCLSKWYRAAAAEQGIEISKDEARQYVYGMAYEEWKQQFQSQATPEQLAAFKEVMSNPDLTS